MTESLDLWLLGHCEVITLDTRHHELFKRRFHINCRCLDPLSDLGLMLCDVFQVPGSVLLDQLQSFVFSETDLMLFNGCKLGLLVLLHELPVLAFSLFLSLVRETE